MKSTEDFSQGSLESKETISSSSFSKISNAVVDVCVSSTPQKTTPILSLKEVREAAEKRRESRQRLCIEPDAILPTADLQERYAMLGEFYDSLDNSFRLLRGSISTFSNIRPIIESSTDRTFTYTHLAQMKYILPEVIEMKKIVTCDELTCCMKPELHINLNINGILKPNRLSLVSGHMLVRKIFHTRLFDYLKVHPEDDVPEETLPEPFNKSKNVCVNETAYSRSTVPPAIQQRASHLSKSFRRSFSSKASGTESFNSITTTLPVAEKTSLVETFMETAECVAASSSSLPATPLKEKFLSKDEVFTPGKFISTPLSATPEMRIQKKCFMTPDDEPNKSVRHSSSRNRNRSLIFDTPVKKSHKNVDEANDIKVKLSIDDTELPDNLMQSITVEEDQDPAISKEQWQKQMISSLPKMYDMIVYLHKSNHRSVFTKTDLIHKIISNHLDIVERGEVEEQIKLLQEIAPEWIHEKLASTGDPLICINKISSPNSVKARLAKMRCNL